MFRGLDRAYGTYQMTEAVEDKTSGKKTGRAVTYKERVTETLYQVHLEGKQGLGIIPIRDDDTCQWGVIDIDEYGKDFNAAMVAKKIYTFQLPAVCTRSKSGGLHVWFFFKDPIPAGKLQAKLEQISNAIGYPSVEVFPKQKTMKSGRNADGKKDDRVGNWINLPYFNAYSPECLRYGFDFEGGRLGFTDFLNFAESRAISAEGFLSLALDLPEFEFADGPPCLQKLAIVGFPQGTRNNGLYNLAVYARKKYSEFADYDNKVQEYNRKFMKPEMTLRESTVIIRSVGKDGAEYNYKCSDIPICDFCNKRICITRKYGIGGGAGAGGTEGIEVSSVVRMIVLNNLGTIVDTDVTWELVINDVVFRFDTEELRSQDSFRTRILNTLNIHVAKVAPAAYEQWLLAVLHKAVEIAVPRELSPEGRLMAMLADFLNNFSEAQHQDDILNGVVYYSNTDAGYWFRGDALLRYLAGEKLAMKERRIWPVLKTYGVINKAKKINARTLSVFFAPEELAERVAPLGPLAATDADF